MTFHDFPNLRRPQDIGLHPDCENSFRGNVLLVLLMVGGVAMPNSLIPYKFCYENPSGMILSESEIIRHTSRIVKPPTIIVFNPLVCMCCVKTGDFLSTRD